MRIIILATLASALAFPVLAQQPTAQPGMVKVAQASDARCRKDVKDYVDTLRLLRETAGSQTGDLVAGAFVSEAELDRVVQAQGPCAAAQMLRDKRGAR